jgi:hypothetical protein
LAFSRGWLLASADVSNGSISTELGLSGHVRSTPDSDRIADVPDRQLRANMQHHILCLEMKEAAN